MTVTTIHSMWRTERIRDMTAIEKLEGRHPLMGLKNLQET